MFGTPGPQETQSFVEYFKVFMCMHVSRTKPCPHEASYLDFIQDSDVLNCIQAQQHLSA